MVDQFNVKQEMYSDVEQIGCSQLVEIARDVNCLNLLWVSQIDEQLFGCGKCSDVETVF